MLLNADKPCNALDTCAVRSRNEWISYNDTRVSVISNQDCNNSPEVQVSNSMYSKIVLIIFFFVGKCYNCHLHSSHGIRMCGRFVYKLISTFSLGIA